MQVQELMEKQWDVDKNPALRYKFGTPLNRIAESSKVHKGITAVAERLDQNPTMRSAMPENSMYVDSMSKVDARLEMAKLMSAASGYDLTKAISISGISSGTQDKSLIPIYVDQTIVDLTRRLTPLVELVPRVTNYGRTAEFNQVTARGITGFLPEDANLSDVNDTYARTSVGIKFAYAVGRVTGPFLAASRQYLANQYIDALNLEVRQKTVSLRYVEEDALINGNATSTRTAYGGNTTTVGYEYNGILNTGSTQTMNPAAGSATTLQIVDLRKAIRIARTANESSTYGQGDPNLILTDFTTYDNVKAKLQDTLRYVNTNFEVAWGLKTVEFEGLPLIASKFMPTTSNARQAVVMSTDTWQMRVLQDVTYQEMGVVNDSVKFFLKLYEALVCTAPQFNTIVSNISDT